MLPYRRTVTRGRDFFFLLFSHPAGRHVRAGCIFLRRARLSIASAFRAGACVQIFACPAYRKSFTVYSFTGPYILVKRFDILTHKLIQRPPVRHIREQAPPADSRSAVHIFSAASARTPSMPAWSVSRFSQLLRQYRPAAGCTRGWRQSHYTRPYRPQAHGRMLP